MTLYMGFAGYFSTRLCDSEERAGRFAELCLDGRWPWQLASCVFGLRERWDKKSRRTKLTGSAARLALRDGIIAPEHRDVTLDHRAAADSNHARLDIETGQRLAVPRWPNPAAMTGMIRAHDLPDGADVLAWVEVMHEIMLTIEVANAVLPVWPTVHMVDSDCTFVSIVLDTPKEIINLGVRKNFKMQRLRDNYWRRALGDQYIRYPRWGTYLRCAHLDRVGGLSRIRDTVPLAKIVELGGAGDLVYLQCTDHPASALSEEGERVRLALEEALAPILTPAQPEELAT